MIMVTGDSVATARAIALESGLMLQAEAEDATSGAVLEGPQFRKMVSLKALGLKVRCVPLRAPSQKPSATLRPRHVLLCLLAAAALEEPSYAHRPRPRGANGAVSAAEDSLLSKT